MDSVAAWFGDVFGQCTKQPATAEDLHFDTEQPDKKKKSNKAKPGPAVASSDTPTAVQKKEEKDEKADSACQRHPVELPNASKSSGNPTGTAAPFLIDSSGLQMNVKSHPGVAFRYSKKDSQKVSEQAPAKWGDIIEGIDEGDGWLKVGMLFLPMFYQGVPIVTPALEKSSPELTTHAQELPAAEKDTQEEQEPATLVDGQHHERTQPAAEEEVQHHHHGVEQGLQLEPLQAVKEVDEKSDGEIDLDMQVFDSPQSAVEAEDFVKDLLCEAALGSAAEAKSVQAVTALCDVQRNLEAFSFEQGGRVQAVDEAAPPAKQVTEEERLRQRMRTVLQSAWHNGTLVAALPAKRSKDWCSEHQESKEAQCTPEDDDIVSVQDVEDYKEHLQDKHLLEWMQSELMPSKQEA